VGSLDGLLAPIAPVRGVIWLAEKLAELAEAQASDPALISRQLEEIQRAREAGELPEHESRDLEERLVRRLLQHRETGTDHWER
jgi:Gas vesicle protein G